MKQYKFKINGREYSVSVSGVSGGTANVSVNGVEYKVELDNAGAPSAVSPVAPVAASATAPVAPAAAPVSKPVSAASGAGSVKSPLPGVIVDVKVKVGDSVKAGQTVVTLEAMKMENNIDAPKSGVVKSVHKNQGDSVMEGDLLVVIE